MNFPGTPEALKEELRLVELEVSDLKQKLKWAEAKRTALQALCAHKNTRSDNDARDPSTYCLDCGKAW